MPANKISMLQVSRHFLFIFLYLISEFISRTQSGHEVVYNTKLKDDDIQPHELAILQYDSRPLNNDNFWTTTAKLNKGFAMKYNHEYIYMSLQSRDCIYASIKLHHAWCKVKAMLAADAHTSTRIKAILYLDTDAVITSNYSMTDVMAFMRKDLHWNYQSHPFAFNQDGPGWACKFTLNRTPYSSCLNSGTVLWVKSSISTNILHDWWHSAGLPYDKSDYPTKWKTSWPWEQAQMYKVYEKYKGNIMVLSFPQEPFLPWTSKKNPKAQYPTDFVEPWCFSHWPGANCFITHHAASVNQKAKILSWYKPYVPAVLVTDIVPFLFVDVV